MTRRILITIEYDGTNYSGWQVQENGPSIQEEIEKALFKAEKRTISITGAGRTDAGVHARGQCANFDTESKIPVEKYPFVLNALLPHDISVSKALEVPLGFSARFCAESKIYTYRIYNRRQPNALKSRFFHHVPMPLDIDKMRLCADFIVGEHDFTAFSAAGGTHKSPVRKVYSIDIVKDGDDILISVFGSGFLYNMVRIIAGTLIAAGLDKISPNIVEQAFITNDRRLLGATAPAKGLELTKVNYSPKDLQEEHNVRIP
ncbi:MAG: tRNA pseudouridine(38-40) synthase TruA [Eubacteriales bacterium]|nr:tRNA pseudouridine(38-40) synthase TruA [Eubacteriales bacterium]